MFEKNVKNTFTTMIRGKKLEDFLKIKNSSKDSLRFDFTSKKSKNEAKRIFDTYFTDSDVLAKGTR